MVERASLFVSIYSLYLVVSLFLLVFLGGGGGLAEALVLTSRGFELAA